MTEKPGPGRAAIMIIGNSLEVKIPTKKKWSVIIVTVVWMFGFTFGIKWMMEEMPTENMPEFFPKFMIFGMAGAALALVLALTNILWLIGGLEIIKISNGIMTIKKQIYSIGVTRNYQIDSIKNLTLNSNSSTYQSISNNRNHFLNINAGVIKFDYGMKTIKFAGEIDEAEGRKLIDTFRQNANFKDVNFG